MFKFGDKVWVTVSRDKERPGTITKLTQLHDGGYSYLVSIEGSLQLVFDNDIRPYGPPITATKNDSTKVRMELIPSASLEAQARAMTYGSLKYSDHNWANGFEWDRLVGSLMRHLNAWRSGEDIDEDSGLNHMDLILANAGMLAAHIKEGLGNDNRRKIMLDVQKK